jgi:subtilase family serine protease
VRKIVHAIAPQAAIRVILIPADVSLALVAKNFSAALRMAPSLGGVVSVSLGTNESCFTSAQVATVHSALQFDDERHVTVAVAAGDFGAEGQPCTVTPTPAKAVVFPASDPLPLAVGGTSLDASHRTGTYIGETVWNRARGYGGSSPQAGASAATSPVRPTRPTCPASAHAEACPMSRRTRT